MRPRIARGVVAIGNIAVGVLAIGGRRAASSHSAAAPVGLLFAIGWGGAGVGLHRLAVSRSDSIADRRRGDRFRLCDWRGAPYAPAIIDGRHCDEAAREFVRRWLNMPTTELSMTCHARGSQSSGDAS